MFGNPFYFSTFSAISELFVTALVLYVIISNMRGESLRWKLLFGTLTFEILVNVAYMVNRTVVIATNHPAPLADWIGQLGAFHGILSLVMLIGLIIIAIIAFRASQRNIQYFQEHRTLSIVFIVLWLISVGSGEVLYFAVWHLN